MLIGYVRVSTNDQNTDLQRNALNCAGCELIFEDKISGTKSERPGLKKLLRTLSAGDTLVVWKLDRLGRSMRHLVILVEELRERGVNFRSLTDAIDTSNKHLFELLNEQKLDWKLLAHRDELVDVVPNLHQNNGRRPGD